MSISLGLASSLAATMGPAELVDAIREIDEMPDADESYVAFRRMCEAALRRHVGVPTAQEMIAATTGAAAKSRLENVR